MNQNDNSINLLGQTIPAPPSVTKIRIIKNTFGFYEKWTFLVKARLFSLEYELLVAQPEHLHCCLKFILFGRISSGYLHYLEPEFSQDIYTIWDKVAGRQFRQGSLRAFHTRYTLTTGQQHHPPLDQHLQIYKEKV